MPLDAALRTLEVPDENWQPAAMARGLMRGYDARWRQAQANIEVRQVEATYESDLINPTTHRKSRTFRLAGKLDKLATEGGLVFYDHKTTSMDISSSDSVYWRQLQIDSQAKHYELLLVANGIKVDRIVWDVIRKPGIRPKKLPAKVAAEVLSLGTYCGFDLSSESLEYVHANREENAELYEHRVAAETLENPDRYFQRRSVERLDAELVEYWEELWDLSKEILSARQNNRWYRNSGACMNYGRPCEYLGICSGHDTPDSDRWVDRESVHTELDLEDTGENVLTNSRLRCFQTCRRKHLYRYEMGITRADEEEAEALYFGSMFHAALDTWWVAASTGEAHGDCYERQANEVCGSRAEDCA